MGAVFAVLVGATFALIGLAVAIWSDKFEQLNLVPTFVITPLTFLGGVFSAHDAPRPWRPSPAPIPSCTWSRGCATACWRLSASPWLGLAVTGGIVLVSLAIALDARHRLQAARLRRLRAPTPRRRSGLDEGGRGFTARRRKRT